MYKQTYFRYTLNLNTNKVVRSTFSNKINSVFANMIDWPIINEEYRGKEYCYVYGVSLVDYTRTALVKKHVCGDSSGDKVKTRVLITIKLNLNVFRKTVVKK